MNSTDNATNSTNATTESNVDHFAATYSEPANLAVFLVCSLVTQTVGHAALYQMTLLFKGGQYAVLTDKLLGEVMAASMVYNVSIFVRGVARFGIGELQRYRL